MQDYNTRDISVAQRQVYILSLLSENAGGYTSEEIVERLKQWDILVTKRTVNRDIDELSSSYAIEEETRNGKTYFVAQKFNMKNVDLTVQDMMALSFVQQLLQEYSHTRIGDCALDMLRKIIDNTGKLNQLHIKELSKTIKNQDVIANRNQNIDPEVERIIASAIEKKQKVRIVYHAWNSDEDTTRIIHPYALIVLDGYLSVEAFCELRQESRTFRLSRIKQVYFMDEKYDEKNTQYANEDKFIYLGGDKPEKIVICFHPQAARYILEYQSDRADHICKCEDGSIIFEKTTTITDEVSRWILSFGSEAKVLQPDNLVATILKEATALQQAYDKEA